MVGLAALMRFNYRKHAHLIHVVLGVGSVLIFLWVILNRAWVGDDAYITFRVVDNFLNGYGLRWNIQERVQVFTHPLWFWVISLVSFFSGEVYLTSIFVGVLFSLFVAIFMLKIKKLSVANSVGILLLSFSGAFVDYSTSGLENSLSHVILSLFAYVYLKKESNHRFTILTLLCGIGGLNRLDLVLFFIPPLVHVFLELEEKKQGLLALLFGTLPITIWLGFSVFYFGFPFPNTFYAKLNHWLTSSELIRQGLIYINHTMLNDPVTGIVLLIGGITTIIHWNSKRALLTLGACLYLIYVVSIGGDFMEGRFITGVFLIIVIGLVHYEIDRIPLIHFGWIIPLLLVFNFYGSVPTFVASSWNFVEPWQDGIVNERAFYWPETGLFRDGVFNTQPGFVWVGDGRSLAQSSKDKFVITQARSVGFLGYYAGPSVYVVDELGLGNALLARIPPQRRANWRIGHFERVIPDGYSQYLQTGNLAEIENEPTKQFLEVLEFVIQEPLTSEKRIKSIIQLNLGNLDKILLQDQYIYPSLVVVDAREVTERKVWLPWNDDGAVIGYDSGIIVKFETSKYYESYEASFAQVQNLEVRYLDSKGKVIMVKKVKLPSSSQLRAYRFQVPDQVVEQGFASIHFLPGMENPQTKPRFSFGHLVMFKNVESLTF